MAAAPTLGELWKRVFDLGDEIKAEVDEIKAIKDEIKAKEKQIKELQNLRATNNGTLSPEDQATLTELRDDVSKSDARLNAMQTDVLSMRESLRQREAKLPGEHWQLCMCTCRVI